MGLQLNEEQLGLLGSNFDSYVEGGKFDKMEATNEYWKVMEGIGIMAGVSSSADVSAMLDAKYGLGDKSLRKLIQEK